ncbi:MAG: NADH-quinone oxidoreductase subunit NuoE [Methylocystaceae bacterium]
MLCSCQDSNSLELGFPDDEVDLSRLDKVLANYHQQPGSLIPVLQKAQDIYGYLPLSVMTKIAEELKLKPARVFGVATFYTQFRLKPLGKYVILLCHGTACHVNGSERIETALMEELKIKADETTPDGLFTLGSAACLGCCSLAPVMMINGQAYGPLTPDRACQVVRDIYTQEATQVEGGQPA